MRISKVRRRGVEPSQISQVHSVSKRQPLQVLEPAGDPVLTVEKREGSLSARAVASSASTGFELWCQGWDGLLLNGSFSRSMGRKTIYYWTWSNRSTHSFGIRCISSGEGGLISLGQHASFLRPNFHRLILFTLSSVFISFAILRCKSVGQRRLL